MLLEGGWTEGVTSALLHMGCALLDTAAMSPPAHTPTAGAPGGAASSAASAAPAASGQLPDEAAADNDAAMWPGGGVAGFVFSGVVPSCLAGVVQPPTLDGVLGAIAAAAAAAATAAAAAAGSGEAAAPEAAVGGRPQATGARQGDSRGGAGSGGEVSDGGGSDGGGGWVAGWASAGWQRRLRSLGAAERRQLRAFLLQSKWFPGTAWEEGW